MIHFVHYMVKISYKVNVLDFLYIYIYMCVCVCVCVCVCDELKWKDKENISYS